MKARNQGNRTLRRGVFAEIRLTRYKHIPGQFDTQKIQDEKNILLYYTCVCNVQCHYSCVCSMCIVQCYYSCGCSMCTVTNLVSVVCAVLLLLYKSNNTAQCTITYYRRLQ